MAYVGDQNLLGLLIILPLTRLTRGVAVVSVVAAVDNGGLRARGDSAGMSGTVSSLSGSCTVGGVTVSLVSIICRQLRRYCCPCLLTMYKRGWLP